MGSEREEGERSEEVKRGRKFRKKTESPLNSEVDNKDNVYIVTQEELFHFDASILKANLIRPNITKDFPFYFVKSDSWF